MIARHPDSCLHYIHVIPTTWGSYVDVAAMYDRLVQRAPWMSVIDPHQFEAALDHHRDDDRVMFVLWSMTQTAKLQEPRRCLVAGVYMEALDQDLTKLLPLHLTHLQNFEREARSYDAVFAHTPWMASELKKYTDLPTCVVPLGWSIEASGGRRRFAPKHQRFLYWGSPSDRRATTLALLEIRLGSDLVRIEGTFGRDVTGALDRVQASLYIAHSPVYSYSTWRLWQTIPTTAAFVGEPGDTWPFIPGRHMITFDAVTSDNLNKVAEQIASVTAAQAQETSDRAYEEIGLSYEIGKVVEDWLVPASLQIDRRES